MKKKCMYGILNEFTNSKKILNKAAVFSTAKIIKHAFFTHTYLVIPLVFICQLIG